MIDTPLTVVYNSYSTVSTSTDTYERRDHLNHFTEELRRYTAQAVPLIFSRLCDALPLDGFIVVDPQNGPDGALEEVDAEQRSEVAARLIPINVSRSRNVERLLESRTVVAAIDSLSFHQWELPRRPPAPIYQLYGRRHLAPFIGARCSPLHMSEHYCWLESRGHMGLPHLLVDYLAAFEKYQHLLYEDEPGPRDS